MKRIETAAEQKSYRLSRGLVKYYDPDTFMVAFRTGKLFSGNEQSISISESIGY